MYAGFCPLTLMNCKSVCEELISKSKKHNSLHFQCKHRNVLLTWEMVLAAEGYLKRSKLGSAKIFWAGRHFFHWELNFQMGTKSTSDVKAASQMSKLGGSTKFCVGCHSSDWEVNTHLEFGVINIKKSKVM